MSAADPLSIIYKQTTGALAVFAADLPATIYKQTTGTSAVFVADPDLTICKQQRPAYSSFFTYTPSSPPSALRTTE
jgi:hypothetical protein